MTAKKLSGRLKAFRKSQEYTQADIADLLEITHQAWGGLERGESNPSLSTIQALIAKTDVNPTWLLTGQGTMETSGAPGGDGPPAEALQPNSRDVSGVLRVEEEETVAQLEALGIELHPIARVGVEAEAGTGFKVHPEDELEEVAEWLPAQVIRTRYKVPPWRVKRLLVRGNSMVPTLQPGQEVRIALWNGEHLWDGRVYVLNSPFGVIIKRLRLRHDHLVIASDNPEEENQKLSGDEFHEHYRVVAWLLDKVESL